MRAGDNLHAEGEVYRAIFDAVPVAIWVHDLSEVGHEIEELLRGGVKDLEAFLDQHPDFVAEGIRKIRVLDVNAAAVTMYGARDKAELMRSLPAILTPNAHGVFREQLLALVRGARDFCAELETRTLDGRRCDVLISVRMPQERGSYAPVLVSVTDITERKQAEKALRDSEERYRDLVEQAGIAIAIDDESGGLPFFNERFAQMLGYSPDEVAGLSHASVIHPDDAQWVGAHHRSRMLGEPSPSRYEFRCIRKDKEVIHVEVVAVTLREGERIVGSRSYMWDITDRKRLEEALEASRASFRSIAEQNADGIVMIDEKGLVRFVNTAAQRFLGRTSQQLLGRRFEVAEGESSEIEVTRTSGEPGVAEIRVVESEWDGKPARLAMLHDITERKRAEEALRASEARYRLLFSRSLSGIYRSSVDGRMLDCNDAFAAIYGYDSPAAALAEPATSFYMRESSRAALLEVLEEAGEVRNFESMGQRRDGQPIWILENAHLASDEAGQVRVIEGSVIDLSDRKRAEEALRDSEARQRALLSAIPDLMFMFDAEGRFADFSARSADDLFVAPEQFLGRSVDEVLPAPQAAVFSLVVAAAAASGEMQRVEYELVVGGVGQQYEARVVPVGDGKVLALVRNRTHEWQLEQEIGQARKMEALGRLAGAIAHDFNNFLMALMGTAEISEMNLPSEHEVRPAIASMRRMAARAAELTKGLLGFARRQPLQLVPMDLESFVRDLLPMLRRLIPENIEIVHEEAGSAVVARGDGSTLQQVMLNLCLNARDAMPDGGSITISAGPAAADAVARLADSVARLADSDSTPYVTIEVRDTGVGMDEETRRRIFEPFFTTKGSNEGTGIGLAAVYGIVKQHQGHIEVESIPGEGSCFSIFLPAASTLGDTGGRQSSADPFNGGSETILLAEDDPEVRGVMVDMLRELGYRVWEAANGSEALDILRRERVDLVVTDSVMPQMGGVELLRAARELEPRLPFLISSGYSEATVADVLTSEPHVDFIAKPYSLGSLAAKIRELMD